MFNKLYKISLIVVIFFNSTAYGILLPKKMHFIWMGDRIESKYIENIKSFVVANPDYEVKVWTDHFDLFSDLPATVKLEKISQLYSEMPLELLWYFIREIDVKKTVRSQFLMPSLSKSPALPLKPNYAAASDILRIQILKREGGIYLDTDISILQNKVDAGQFGLIDAPIGFVFPVKVKKEKKFYQDSYSDAYSMSFNNHMMGSIPGHPLLTEIEKKQIENYRKFLLRPEVAVEQEFELARYGVTGSGYTHLTATVHAGNFWQLKLGAYGWMNKYILTHKTTGFDIIHYIVNNKELLEGYCQMYLAEKFSPNPEQDVFDLASFMEFPSVINDLVHDNKCLWTGRD